MKKNDEQTLNTWDKEKKISNKNFQIVRANGNFQMSVSYK